MAPALLLLAILRHYGWGMVPPELAGIVDKGLASVVITALIWWLWARARDRSSLTFAVLCWWTWEELQVSLCSLLWALKPWQVGAGQAICSAKIGIDLGAFGLLAAGLLAYHVAVSTDSTRKGKQAK